MALEAPMPSSWPDPSVLRQKGKADERWACALRIVVDRVRSVDCIAWLGRRICAPKRVGGELSISALRLVVQGVWQSSPSDRHRLSGQGERGRYSGFRQ